MPGSNQSEEAKPQQLVVHSKQRSTPLFSRFRLPERHKILWFGLKMAENASDKMSSVIYQIFCVANKEVIALYAELINPDCNLHPAAPLIESASAIVCAEETMTKQDISDKWKTVGEKAEQAAIEKGMPCAARFLRLGCEIMALGALLPDRGCKSNAMARRARAKKAKAANVEGEK